MAITAAGVDNLVSKASDKAIPKIPKQDIPTSIPQSERLFTVRSRAIDHLDERGEYAYIKLMTTNPEKSLNRGASGHHAAATSINNAGKGVLNDAINGDKGYANFLLTDINTSFDEKLQIVEVMGDAEVSYYFGRSPILFELNGLLVDSPDNNWFIEFVEMYSTVLRGTELAMNYELVKLVLPNMDIIGTISRMRYSQNSSRDTDIPFGFTILAKQIIPKPVTLSNRPTAGSKLINWDKAGGLIPLTQKDINSVKSTVTSLQNVMQNPFSTSKEITAALNALKLPSTSNVKIPGVNTDGISAGVPGPFTTAVNDIAGNLGDAFKGINKATAGTLNGVAGSTGLFSSLSANLSGIRAALYSQVYGPLSALTKLVKTVTGGLNSVINAFTTPVRDILRDIRNISNQAIGIVNLINNGIQQATNQVKAFDADIRNTLGVLKKTAGVITTAPQTIASSIRGLVNAGTLPATRAWLASGGGAGLTLMGGVKVSQKTALLNSGARYSAQQGAKL